METKPKRLLVTGSRNWTDNKKLMVAITNQWVKWGKPADAILVSGNASKGADHLAEEVWDELGLTIEFHPAEWSKYGKQAGFIRNQEMVDLGADICLAFIAPCISKTCREPHPHDSHGAYHTAMQSVKAGIKTRVYRP